MTLTQPHRTRPGDLELSPEAHEQIVGSPAVRGCMEKIWKSAGRFTEVTGLDIDDAKQEAALKACKAAFKWKPEKGASPFTYIFGALGLFERQAYRPFTRCEEFNRGHLRLEFGETTIDTADHRVDCEADTDNLELCRMLLAELDDRSANIVSMRCSGCTLQEIANEFGITKERIRQIYIKAINKMRQFAEGME